MINVIYLKKDLRILDNLLFQKAEQENLDYRIIFIFEPELMKMPYFDIRHYQFCFHSIISMNLELKKYSRKVEMFFGSPMEVFIEIDKIEKINKVFSYQETGTKTTFERDKKLKNLFKKLKINWIEFEKDGIIRGLKNRENWREKLTNWLYSPIIFPKITNSNLKLTDLNENNFKKFLIPEIFLKKILNYPSYFQKPGEKNAVKKLYEFLEKKSIYYLKSISKPFLSQFYSSRLSSYLSWGNISAKYVYQKTKDYLKTKKNKTDLNAFLSRIYWRSHLIQKFESMIDYEDKNINNAFENEIIYDKKNDFLIESWKNGETGLDIIDATMKCLKLTGWINFRMRAMTVSFFCHGLRQNWIHASHILARYFLDFEPGIHFPQIQMQAGITGINTIRIYNPIKQEKDNDKERNFINKWIDRKKKNKIITNWEENIKKSKEILWKIKKSNKNQKDNLLKILS